MTIKIVHGLTAGRQALLNQRTLDEISISHKVTERIKEVFGEALTPQQAVARIIADVRCEGDAALHDYTRRIDGMVLDGFQVSEQEVEAAYQETPQELREAMEQAAGRIAAFHRQQRANSWLEWDDEGGAVGQMVRPLERVGVYVPGGTAPYPSTLLMAAVPARIAGVQEIIVASPPGADGRVAGVILAAAWVAGVERVYRLGGAQAIAALAYGTESVPRVDKIVGPGNLFVVLAKRQVYGQVDIDSLPGPTETLVIADGEANPTYVAADLLAQAEHDALAAPILVTTSDELAQAVQDEIEVQLPALSRKEIIVQALNGRGSIVVVENLEEALDLANDYAPEHLCLLVAAPWAWVGRVRHAGGVFVGEACCEALGDYVVGPSHVMPTGRTARFASPLNVWDFVKITSVFALGAEKARAIAPFAIELAEAEGLTAHARAVRLRAEP
jgi:histidinol dehydrogenase